MTYMTENYSKKQAKKQNQAIVCDNVQKVLIIDTISSRNKPLGIIILLAPEVCNPPHLIILGITVLIE